MAEFKTNPSKNIPAGACEGQKCDSAGNCYCPTDENFNPLLIPLQIAGLANVAVKLVTGEMSLEPPKAEPEISAKSNEPNYMDRMEAQARADAAAEAAYDSIDWDAYSTFALDFAGVQQHNATEAWGKVWDALSTNFFSGNATPEQLGQMAALNKAADITGEFPSTRLYDSSGLMIPDFTSFSLSAPSPVSLPYTDFGSITGTGITKE